jgi:hypothetical protein
MFRDFEKVEGNDASDVYAGVSLPEIICTTLNLLIGSAKFRDTIWVTMVGWARIVAFIMTFHGLPMAVPGTACIREKQAGTTRPGRPACVWACMGAFQEVACRHCENGGNVSV